MGRMSLSARRIFWRCRRAVLVGFWGCGVLIGLNGKLEGIFAKEDFTRVQVVEAIKEFIPNFEHEEKGKNLDQKM